MGSNGEAPGYNTAATSGGIGVMAHQTLARRMPQKPPRIPLSTQGMRVCQAHDSLQALPLS
jgi:hypothetical protein